MANESLTGLLVTLVIWSSFECWSVHFDLRVYRSKYCCIVYENAKFSLCCI